MELNAIEVIERIKSLLSQKELNDLGFSANTVTNWKYRNTIPKSEDLYKIAQKIGVSMEYLLTGEFEEKISDEDAVVLAYYHTIPEQNKKLFLNIAKLMIE